MASTNKTTHYELSQYIGTDKPTYLTDYNQDMAKIDAGIYGAKSVADTNAVNIGDLDELSTTSKTDLVNAVNEVDSDISTLSSTVGDNTSDIGALQGNVGNLTNLNTTNKNNLVSAINEVNNNIGDLSNLDTTIKSDVVNALNEVRTEVYKQKRVTLASGNYTVDGTKIINLSEDVRNFDDVIIGGGVLNYTRGQLVLATDKIELGVEYDVTAIRNSSLYYSMQFKFISYTQIEITFDNTAWASNKGFIDFVEGQHL